MDVTNLPLGDGPLVLRISTRITEETAARLRAEFANVTHRKIVVLGPEQTIEALPEPGQIDRIEQKLDMLLAALAEDADTDVLPIEGLEGTVHQATNGDSRSL